METTDQSSHEDDSTERQPEEQRDAEGLSPEAVALLQKHPQLRMRSLFEQPYPSWRGIRDDVSPDQIPFEKEVRDVQLPQEPDMRMSMYHQNGHVVIAAEGGDEKVEEIYHPGPTACIGNAITDAKAALREKMAARGNGHS